MLRVYGVKIGSNCKTQGWPPKILKILVEYDFSNIICSNLLTTYKLIFSDDFIYYFPQWILLLSWTPMYGNRIHPSVLKPGIILTLVI